MAQQKREETDMPRSLSTVLRTPSSVIALVAVLLAPGLAAAEAQHEDGMAHDAQPAYAGTGHTGGALRPDAEGRVLDMPASGVALLSWLSLQDIPGSNGRASDVWGHVSPSGREYAILGCEKGTAFVDISDPVQPVLAGYIASPASIWKEVASYGDYAYVVTEAGGGMQVIDMRRIDEHIVTLARTITAGGLSTVHTIRVNPESGYLYLNGSNLHHGGLVVFDARNPAFPVLVGSWSRDYVHDSVTTTYNEGPFAGREITFACLGIVSLGILDVTDKSNIQLLSEIVYPNLAYCHYGWLDEAKRYFYVNDELDESDGLTPTTTTYVVDVEDLLDPTYVTSFTNGSTAIDHNPIGRDGFLFEANYRSGLRIYDIRDPMNALEVGYFDTYPEDDDAHFNGAWGVHLMPSGAVLVSDIERGLFVFDASAITGAPVEPGGPASDPLVVYPNPARGPVQVRCSAAGAIAVVDVSGRVVAEIARDRSGQGSYLWDPERAGRHGGAVPNGVYYVVLSGTNGRVAGSKPVVIGR